MASGCVPRSGGRQAGSKLRNTFTQQLLSGASVSDPYQRLDLSNCGAGRFHVAITFYTVKVI